ncbi:MAG: sensor domain-containing diguanylate cyclase [Deltaproteobacteria bacterium]|nr:sensor domain-containing diguanylate cyclase [Deltaproteobacteria bacterium]
MTGATGKIKEKKSEKPALEAFRPFEHFCKALLDAYALVDKTGQILKCNQLFSSLTGKSSRQILKADSFDHLITMNIAGKPLSIQQILSHQTPTRIDEVRGDTEDRSGLNLILGIYPLSIPSEDQSPGSFILIRDVTAETNLQDKYKVKATQSITDKLTGLYNRVYFEQYLPNALRDFSNNPGSEQKISIIMADIDHFKSVNDTWGHQAGDFILEKVAHIFRQNFRKSDILCRYGGEEFLAILPSTEIKGALLAAEKLRSAIEADTFIFNGTNIPVTMSLGLSQIKIGYESGNEAISRADAALYKAKKNGRNRVCLHDDDKHK